ncbi:MAG: tetratricopeptide repeat protein [Methylacidiphilales bacterium]|nr:tetratricopeptide repeat protein [Candidatus Methylacidiphilales bacterium]
MATLESDDSNIFDAEATNWRLIVYPILAALVVIVGGFGYYYYLQNQREQLEATARAALAQATTPEELVKVADQYPATDQATLALLGAANGSFSARNFDAAIKDYQRIIQTASTDADLRDPAQLGLASSLEASGKSDDAISAYLVVAQRGSKSPYAPFAYDIVARIYEQRGDKNKERQTLTALAGLDPDSAFVKQAQVKLKELNAALPAPAAPASTTNAAPTPASVSATNAPPQP